MYDTLIHNGLVMTLDKDFRILSPGAVAVRHGVIAKVWSPRAAAPLPAAGQSLDAGGGLIMPGLVNAHTHMPMSLFRGLADDLPLDKWLNEHIFPAESRHVAPQSVELGSRLAMAEMLLSGTTTCCDGYFLAGHVAGAVAKCGMRAVLGQGVLDFPAPGVPDPSQNVDHAKSFVRQWLDQSPLLRPSIFCHSPYTCSTHTLVSAKQAANELGVLFQIHVAESQFETQQCRQAHGCSPIRYLQQVGILDEKTLLVHAVWVDPDDIRIIAESEASVAHCPESNMKLASGIAPVPDYLAAGIAVGLGTDGCASNNDLDMLGEMDSAAKLHKVQRFDPTVMDAETVLRMATTGGARALGMAREIGSLEAGKQADVIIIDLDQPHLTPLYNPASQLVYAARGTDIRHVMVAGQWVVKDRRLLTLDLPLLLREAREMGQAIGSG